MMKIELLNIGDRVQVRLKQWAKARCCVTGDVVGFMRSKGVVVRALVEVPYKADERQVVMASGDRLTWIYDGRRGS